MGTQSQKPKAAQAAQGKQRGDGGRPSPTTFLLSVLAFRLVGLLDRFQHLREGGRLLGDIGQDLVLLVCEVLELCVALLL